LSELAAGRQPLTLLDPAARQVLLEHPDAAIRQAAADLFAEGTRGHWAEQFPQYRDLNPQLGSAQQGQAVFRQHCAGCHRMEDLGHAVGPDLMALTDKSSAALLQAILDPNADIDARYVAYLILTDEGQVVHGVLQSESAASLTLVGQDGKQWQVSRSRIEEIRRTDKSLMPEGLERELTPTALQDLLAYLGATATKIRYQYPVGSGPHPIYPDSTPPGKLVDGRHGTGRFDDGQWVSFSHVGRRPQQANFDLGAAQGLTEIRITYGVNHVPGVIHAPRTMQLRLKSADGSVVAAVTVDDWDDTADGLGVYQIARRHKRVTLAATTARFVELEWENDYEWSSLVEVEFNPTHEPDPPAPPPTPTADESASARIMALVATADVGSADEYRVIPEIWREALEAGKRNQTEELRGMLADVLPKMDQPLRDWQAVVIGGGIINGLSQVGLYPGPRLREILADQPEVLHRMERSLALASDMADHEPTPAGTRYDALRMVALSPWSAAQTPLQRYLQAGTNHELQQGAVSGLVDVPEPAAVGLLHAALDFLPQDLQELAVQGMASDRRRDRWKAALKSGIVPPQQLHPRLQALRGVD
jgi:putative heme-binding domain-containing protein